MKKDYVAPICDKWVFPDICETPLYDPSVNDEEFQSAPARATKLYV